MSTLVTPRATLSFPHLFAARAAPGSTTKKFSCTLIFNAADMNTPAMQALLAAIQQAAVDKFGANIPANMKHPFTRGEVKYPGDAFYAGKVLLNANANEEYPPQVVGENRQPIMDRAAIYPGCQVVAGVRFYGYDTAGNRGVGCGLQAVMKVGEGERLDSRVDAVGLFANVHADAPAPVQFNAPTQGTQQGAAPVAGGFKF